MLGFEESESYEHVASPDASPEQRALLARAYAVLDKLPAAERVAWVLHEMEGEKLEDVARHLGCSLATVKRRIVAAKKALEENLS